VYKSYSFVEFRRYFGGMTPEDEEGLMMEERNSLAAERASEEASRYAVDKKLMAEPKEEEERLTGGPLPTAALP
jgi:hypothetical protein